MFPKAFKDVTIYITLLQRALSGSPAAWMLRECIFKDGVLAGPDMNMQILILSSNTCKSTVYVRHA